MTLSADVVTILTAPAPYNIDMRYCDQIEVLKFCHNIVSNTSFVLEKFSLFERLSQQILYSCILSENFLFV